MFPIRKFAPNPDSLTIHAPQFLSNVSAELLVLRRLREFAKEVFQRDWASKGIYKEEFILNSRQISMISQKSSFLTSINALQELPGLKWPTRFFNLYGAEVLSIIRTLYDDSIYQGSNTEQAPTVAGSILIELPTEQARDPPLEVKSKKRGRPPGSKNKPKVGAPNKRARSSKENVPPS